MGREGELSFFTTSFLSAYFIAYFMLCMPTYMAYNVLRQVLHIIRRIGKTN